MLRITTEADDIREYQIQLERAFERKGNMKVRCTVATRDSLTQAKQVIWLPDVSLWFWPDRAARRDTSEVNRYWNVFGIQEPIEYASISPRCQICVPANGINRSIAGGFAADAEHVFLIHRGNHYGGGKQGVTKDYFWRHYSGQADTMIDGKQENRLHWSQDWETQDSLQMSQHLFIGWIESNGTNDCLCPQHAS